MRDELLRHLREITQEERVLLQGHGSIQKGIYTSGKDFVVDNAKLLERGHLIEPPHPLCPFSKTQAQLCGTGVHVLRQNHTYHQ